MLGRKRKEKENSNKGARWTTLDSRGVSPVQGPCKRLRISSPRRRKRTKMSNMSKLIGKKTTIIQYEWGKYFTREVLYESRLFFNRVTDAMKCENWIEIATELSPVHSFG